MANSNVFFTENKMSLTLPNLFLSAIFTVYSMF